MPVLAPETVAALALVGVAVGLVGLLVALAAPRRAGHARRAAASLEARYQTLMTGASGEDIAAALESYIARVAAAEARLDAAEGRAGQLETRLERALQRVRILRYSAFEDAGGDQSFAIALLDDRGDGLVLSGLYSRAGVRVYAKPVTGGRSPYTLSAEEQQAITEAGPGN